MKKRFSDEQFISILREAEARVSALEFCRKHAISDSTFYTCRRSFSGMEMSEVKRLSCLKRRTLDSGSYLLKPCWIRRGFRWFSVESNDDRPESGSR
jgi:hypothetical protein